MDGGPSNETNATSFVSLYATTFVVGVTMITLGPLLDPILRDLDIPLAQGGLISVGFAVGMLIGVVSLNFFLARVPVKWGLVGAAWCRCQAFWPRGSLREACGHSYWPTCSWVGDAFFSTVFPACGSPRISRPVPTEPW